MVGGKFVCLFVGECETLILLHCGRPSIRPFFVNGLGILIQRELLICPISFVFLFLVPCASSMNPTQFFEAISTRSREEDYFCGTCTTSVEQYW